VAALSPPMAVHFPWGASRVSGRSVAIVNQKITVQRTVKTIHIRQRCTAVLAVVAAFCYFGQRTSGVWKASARAYRRRRATEKKRIE